jgi:hypothetical protein
MPGNNGFWFDDDQEVPPGGPKVTKQNPKQSVLDSQPGARLFPLQYTQLLPQGKNLEAEVVAGTKECAEASEKVDEQGNHGPEFIPQDPFRRPH